MYTTIKYFLSPSTQYIYKFLVNAMTEICLNFFAVSIKEILLLAKSGAQNIYGSPYITFSSRSSSQML
jgi:hypothetical protein